jgi:hypothetical protein
MAWVIERRGAKGTSYMGCYRDPAGKQRSAGTFPTSRAAERAAYREELKVNDGQWHDTTHGKVTFRTYVETAWLPSRHIEPSTLAGYQSYLKRQFYPFFGSTPMNKILPSHIQEWVTTAAAGGLSAASIRKYHMMLHSVFRRAVRDRIITFNPCEETELPKVVTQRRRTLTPDEYRRVLAAVPDRYRLMVQVAVETGLRWGELIALRPGHLDFLHGTLTVEETIVEVPKRAAPNGQRMILKPYPKDNEWRRMGLRPRDCWISSAPTSATTNSVPTTCCSPPATAPRSPVTPSAAAPGNPPSPPRVSTSTSGSTTSAMPTRPGCSQAAPI